MQPAVGQTRRGRLGDAPPAAAAGDSSPQEAAADPQQFIKDTVANKPAAVFSKLTCPSSRKAKEVLQAHLPPGSFPVVELDQRPDGPQLQDELERLTGKHSVPSVWIQGRFIGGADELSQLGGSGQLEQRLRA